MGVQSQALRALIASGEPFIAADVYSALTARIVEHVGFKCAYLGGAACCAMHYAIPDFGVYMQAEQIEQAARIVQAIDIPLIADADTLGETTAEAYRLTRMYERAGIAGVHVEDEVNPRHSAFDHGLIPIVEMQAKLAACVEARSDPAFLIIARSDELYDRASNGGGGGDLAEAIKRGTAYAEAGADTIVYPKATPEQVLTLSKELPIPVCTLGPLREGAIFAMYTGWGWSAAAKVHLQQARELFEKGVLPPYTPKFEGDEEIINETLYGKIIRDWARRTGRPTR